MRAEDEYAPPLQVRVHGDVKMEEIFLREKIFLYCCQDLMNRAELARNTQFVESV